MAKVFVFSSDKTLAEVSYLFKCFLSEFNTCCCSMSPSFRNGLNHLSTPSGLILAASKVKGGFAKYIGNPILSKKIPIFA